MEQVPQYRKTPPTPAGRKGREWILSRQIKLRQKKKTTILKSNSDPGSVYSMDVVSFSGESQLKRDQRVENLVEILEGDSEDEKISETPGIVNINLPNGSIKRKMSPKEFLEGLQPVVVVKKMTSSKE